MIIPVILSGGSGTRLWPLSRASFPKQFLSLFGNHSFFQNTLTLVQARQVYAAPVVVCHEQHRFLVAEQIRTMDIPDATILLETASRNTAPAVACGALVARAQDRDALILVLPADHLIQDPVAFHKAVATGMAVARQGRLVTFGVLPTHPHTGFGYIRKGRPLAWTDGGAPEDGGTLFAIDHFVEKPDLATATACVQSGHFFWNSGIFLFQANTFLQELERLAPAIHKACVHAVEEGQPSFDFFRLGETAYAQCPEDSVDYAVMEKTTEAVVVPLQTPWNDMGSWHALWEEGAKDADGNVLHGDILLHEVTRSIIRSESRLVVAMGLDQQVVVETADVVLVASKEKAQDVKKIVKQLHDMGRPESRTHLLVHRPWGHYQSLEHDCRYQVKKITVHCGAKLSLQMHHHRSECWIVVRGTARVTKGDEFFLLSEGQSTSIPLGMHHRLENVGSIPLEVIEIQYGSYLGEDDIVRFEDHYGRPPGHEKIS